jgi:hypothetical protein
MKKLHLNVDALRVESFATQRNQGGTGTVNGHQVWTVEGNCSDTTTWGQTQYCSNNCSRVTCVGCTEVD